MRLLTSVDTADEAERLEQLFTASGVPVFIEDDYTRTNSAERLSSFGYRVHIYVEEQEEDARRLLLDPEFEVAAPIDCDKFYEDLERVELERKARIPDQVDKTLNWLASAAALVAIAWGIWKVATST